MSYKAGHRADAQPGRFVLAGVPEWEAPVPHPGWLSLDRHSARPFRVRLADAEAASHCLHSLGEARCGLDLAPAMTYELHCGRRRWMILLDRALLSGGGIDALTHGRSAPAAVASRDEQTGAWSISYLALSAPGADAGELLLSVFRTTGRLAFGGAARVADGHASFFLHATSRPGAFAIALEGRLDERGLVVDTALSSPGIVVPKQVPVEE